MKSTLNSSSKGTLISKTFLEFIQCLYRKQLSISRQRTLSENRSKHVSKMHFSQAIESCHKRTDVRDQLSTSLSHSMDGDFVL